MAEQSQTGDLEQQLRDMILSNVRIDQAAGHTAAPPGFSQPGQAHHHTPHRRGDFNGRWNGHQSPSSDRGFGRDACGQGRGFRGSSGHRGYGHHRDGPRFNGHGGPAQQLGSDVSFNREFSENSEAQHQTRQGHHHHFHGRGHNGRGGPGPYAPGPGRQLHGSGIHAAATKYVKPADNDGYSRGPPPADARIWSSQPPRGPSFDHRSSPHRPHADQGSSQTRFSTDQRIAYLDNIANALIPEVRISQEELESKDAFRRLLENIFREIQCESGEATSAPMSIQSFGSLRSGFATKGSDMDLVIVNDGNDEAFSFSMHDDSIARRLEKRLLNQGIGARLLARARVPIIKVCQSPPPELLQALRDARQQWDDFPQDEKDNDAGGKKKEQEAIGEIAVEVGEATENGSNEDPEQRPPPVEATPATDDKDTVVTESRIHTDPSQPATGQPTQNRNQKRWLREKKKGPLDFPKDGVGIQCDINFFNPLGLHNSQMLYCYSLCDPRVQPMVLFVKSWAKTRKINSPYSGTLSSYGYVLMVLHYLMNVARPPVIPNLQLEAQKRNLPTKNIDSWEVGFWGDEEEIKSAVAAGQMSSNRQTLGGLLSGFFQYYATTMSGFGFVWMKMVLSLRTPGGILSKEEKGWTGAKTETVDYKEIRHRYLFALEDPFETEHNIARTVTHNGVVAIRDEFRRAWRILGAVLKGLNPHDGQLMDELLESAEPAAQAA